MDNLSTVEAVLKTKNQLVRGDANGKNSLMGNGEETGIDETDLTDTDFTPCARSPRYRH